MPYPPGTNQRFLEWSPDALKSSYFSGGWATYSSEKNNKLVRQGMMTIPNWMDSHKIPWVQTTNQSMIQVHAVLFVQIRYVVIILYVPKLASR